MDIGGLGPEEDVLDVGSAVGIVAVGLTDWRKVRCERIDDRAARSERCQRTIRPCRPNLRSQGVDLSDMDLGWSRRLDGVERIVEAAPTTYY